MASIKAEYAGSSALTITLASLATSSSLISGAESAAVDNTTNKYLDYLLAGKVTTGTTPTAGGMIEVNVVGMVDDTTWPDIFDGTASAETVTTAGIKAAICRQAAMIEVEATNNQAYWFGPVSVASLFGGVLPKKFVVFCSQSTGANLNSTAGNHAISITPAYATSA